MKTLLTCLTAALLLAAAAIPKTARAEVDIDFFYDSLAPYGSWMDVGDYGYVWHPEVEDDWQPYTNGRWVYTDAGWTWDSDEPYSWAVYHYGRWAQVIGLGWVWVPDNEWGPAWVSWRNSPKYIGWAPLPPEARFIASIGFSNWVDSYYDIGPGRYRFVSYSNFGAPNLRRVFIDRRQNYLIINQTTNITNISYGSNGIFNRGPDFEMVNRRLERPIERYRLDRRLDFNGDPRSLRADDFRSRHEDGALHLFAPRVGNRIVGAPNKIVGERIRNVEINRGWRGAGLAPDKAEALREKLRTQAKVPDALPEKPRFERPTAGGPRSPGADRNGDGRPDGVGKPDETPRRPGMVDRNGDGRPDGVGKPDETPRRPGMVDRNGDGRPDGVGKPDETPRRPGMVDRNGDGRPDGTVPGRIPSSPGGTTPDLPGKGKGRPGGAPEGPKGKSETDIPSRPTIPGGETRPGMDRKPTGPEVKPSIPKVERPEAPERPSIPKVNRPDAPERPSIPKVNRPEAPERPSIPKVNRPDAPERPSIPKVNRPDAPERPSIPKVNRPEAPSRPKVEVQRPAPPANRPSAPAARPAPPTAPKAAPAAAPDAKKKKGAPD